MATLAEIRRVGKSSGQHYLWHMWVIRPLSYYIVWLFIKLGISANQTSVLGGIAGITGCVLLAFGSYQLTLIAVFLMVLYCLSDCADGAIARVTGTASNHGHLLDLAIDYTVKNFMPLAVSFGLYWETGAWLYLVIGGIYTYSRLLSIVIAYAHNAILHNKVQTKFDNKLVKWGTRILLLEMPVFTVCAALNHLEIFLGLYALLFASKTMTVILTILIKRRVYET